MFYLMMHSTHLTTHSTQFIYGYMEGRKELFYLTMHSTHFILQLYGRKEMFYLTTHSTHLTTHSTQFIYGYMEGRKEGIVLFNDAFNTFYFMVIWKEGIFYLTTHSTHFILRLYGRKEYFI